MTTSVWRLQKICLPARSWLLLSVSFGVTRCLRAVHLLRTELAHTGSTIARSVHATFGTWARSTTGKDEHGADKALSDLAGRWVCPLPVGTTALHVEPRTAHVIAHVQSSLQKLTARGACSTFVVRVCRSGGGH